MVAVIKVGSSIRRTFHYNENKVDGGVAALIRVVNYPAAMETLTANQRLNMLLRTAESNPNVRSNSVHISLNFACEDKLNDDMLVRIAEEYMNAIGFGQQPYLVYRHDDAAHPHIHIATVKVDADGQRIETQNIGKTLSEPARKTIEAKYGLVRAEAHRRELYEPKPIQAERVRYGKTPTRNAIAAVLENVLGKYRFTSLPELNAVLNLYCVAAERGTENSRTFKKRGLVYRVLDDKGTPVGTPIKASLFHNRPTLDFLEKQFLRNEVARQPHKEKLKSSIDFVLRTKRPDSLESLTDYLKKEGITAVLRKSKEGAVFGITYVDFKSRCVFNGSALSKRFSAKGLLDTLGVAGRQTQPMAAEIPAITAEPENKKRYADPVSSIGKNTEEHPTHADSGSKQSLLEQLLSPEFAPQSVPFEWKKKKRRKKKR